MSDDKKRRDDDEVFADEGKAKIRAFWMYQGEKPKYFHDAKFGAVALGYVSKRVAARNNETALRMAAERREERRKRDAK